MLNKYRKVEYDDDGCTVYECLQCYEQWNARHFGTNFCGFCGTKWDGELEWDSEAKYDHKYPHRNDYSKNIKRVFQYVAPSWQLWCRTIWEGDEGEWETYGSPFKANSINVYNWLKVMVDKEMEYRKVEHFKGFGVRTEYKMVLVSRKDHPQNSY